jgi:hypothetical protein
VNDPDRRAGAWYRALSRDDRILIDAVKTWLSPIRWQHFVTLEFPWHVRAETAAAKLREFLNNVERELRDSVCFIGGLEEQSKSGEPVPAHFHLLVTSARPIPEQLLKEVWWRMVGHGARKPPTRGSRKR